MEDFDTSTARADAEKELQPHLKILNYCETRRDLPTLLVSLARRYV